MQPTRDEAARLEELTKEFRSRDRLERHLALYRMILEVLDLFRREGVTRQVQFGSTLAGMLINEPGVDLPPLSNGLSVRDAMTMLASGDAIPPWSGAAFEHANADLTKKRRQHYIWQFYLKAWADKEDAIWCRRRGAVPFRTGTTAVGLERDFYRLQELTTEDITLLEGFIDKADSPRLREVNRGWLLGFNTLFVLKREYEARGKRNEALETMLDVEINNLEENLHAGIEKGAIPLLESLRSGDLSFLEDKKAFAQFAHFLAVQSLRGPGLEHRIMQGWGNTRTIGVLRHVMATSLGRSLYVGRASLRISLLEAHPSSEFITGDEYVMNTRAVRGVPPTLLELYYPVSPRLAFLMTADDPNPGQFRVPLDAPAVAAYNKMIESRAHQQLYASSKEALISVWAEKKRK